MLSKKPIAFSALLLVTFGVAVSYLITAPSPDLAPVAAPTSAAQDGGHSSSSTFAPHVASQAPQQAAPESSTGSKDAANPARPATGRGVAETVNATSRATAQHSELSTPAPAGEQTIATVTNAGAQRTFTPNEIGHFPRVYIKANQTVPVEVSYPDGQPGDPVVIQVEDGGGLDGALPAKVDKLDSLKKIGFKFKANADLGVYRVVLRKGADLRILDFWVGDEQPMAQR